MNTDETKKMSMQELAERNMFEERKIYTNFNPDDKGESRILICKCKTSSQAINVLTAIRTAALESKFELAETIHKLISTNELADQSDSMLRSAIDAMVQIGMDSSEWVEMQALLEARTIMKDLEYEWKKENK
jgi:hypothetical protein